MQKRSPLSSYLNKVFFKKVSSEKLSRLEVSFKKLLKTLTSAKFISWLLITFRVWENLKVDLDKAGAV